MCLHVMSTQCHRIVKCYKWLYRGNGFCTPHQHTDVPKDGWLLPETDNVEYSLDGDTLRHEMPADRILKGSPFCTFQRIYGGCIHAYEKDWLRSGDFYIAYAFRVFAYGKDQDLACLALYIPIADYSGNRPKILDIIGGEILQGDDAFDKLFPYAPERFRKLFPSIQENSNV